MIAMDTRAPSTLRSAEEYLNDLLTTDREFREEWYANVLGRTFGLAVFTYRTDQGLTQTALGKTLGIPQSQIARIEDGEHTPSLPKCEARREISKTLQRGVCDATDQVVISVRECSTKPAGRAPTQ